MKWFLLFALFVIPLKDNARVRLSRPRWMIAFARSHDIWIALSDGTRQKRIITNGKLPCWAFDHSRIVYARSGEIWMAHSDGTNARCLVGTNAASEHATVTGITWDALSRSVWFSRQETCQVVLHDGQTRNCDTSGIYEIGTTAGKAAKPVTFLDIMDGRTGFQFFTQSSPSMSQSGRWLAFLRNGDVWYAKRNELRSNDTKDLSWKSWGWDASRLVEAPQFDWASDRSSLWTVVVSHCSWSPRGDLLAYSTQRMFGSGAEYVMVLDVTKKNGFLFATRKRLLLDLAKNPCFAPDGRSLFCEGIGPHKGIFQVKLDGSLKRILADGHDPAL